jgi:hypothetical protein
VGYISWLKPNPLTLEAVMLLWTPSETQKWLTCKFIPPPTGLTSGLVGDLDTQASFRDQRSLFFPAPSKVMGSIWQTYMEHEGYIFKYHQFLKKGWTLQKDIKDLYEALCNDSCKKNAEFQEDKEWKHKKM